LHANGMKKKKWIHSVEQKGRTGAPHVMCCEKPLQGRCVSKRERTAQHGSSRSCNSCLISLIEDRAFCRPLLKQGNSQIDSTYSVLLHVGSIGGSLLAGGPVVFFSPSPSSANPPLCLFPTCCSSFLRHIFQLFLLHPLPAFWWKEAEVVCRSISMHTHAACSPAIDG